MLIEAWQGLTKHSGIAKRQKYEETITFSKADVAGVKLLHTDAVVVTLNITDYNVHRVLLDNGSSIKILYYFAFSQMNISSNWMEKFGSPIHGFFEKPLPVKGVITVPVIAGTPPQWTIV